MPGNFIRIHRTISPLSPISASCCLQAQGGEPCQLLHSKMEGSVSSLLQVPGHTSLPTPPLCHHWLRDQGLCQDALPFSPGKGQSQELDGTHCPFSHHLLPLLPSSDVVNAWTSSWLIIHHQLLLKQPQTKLQKPLRLRDINSSQHQRQT